MKFRQILKNTDILKKIYYNKNEKNIGGVVWSVNVAVERTTKMKK